VETLNGARSDTDPPQSPVRRRLRIWSLQVQDRPFALAAGVGCATALLAAAIVWFIAGAPPAAVEDRLPRVGSSAGVPEPTITAPGVHVHMAGEVTAPGLYRLGPGTRVADSLDAAGGPTPRGDADRLNLAALLVDGERIVVPRAVAPGDEPLGDQFEAFGGSEQGGPVNLNRADAALLATLPGIGPSLAAAIVGYRERSGPFPSIEALEDVPGIGPAKLSQIRDLVRV
jgi:competence protein ComEA